MDSDFNQLKTRSKFKARPKFNSKIYTSGTPVLKFEEISTDFNGPNKLNSQSCLLSKQISQERNFHAKKGLKSIEFYVNEIMSAMLLGVRSLIDYKYREQQLVEEAINRYKYKDQLLEWYDNVDINSVKIKSTFGAVGSDADVYNDDAGDIESRDSDCFLSTRWYNDRETKFIDVKTYFCNGEFVPDNEGNATATNMSAVSLFEDYEYSMYDGIRAQMDEETYTVTTKIELLRDVRLYKKKFQPNAKMQGATSEAVIVPEA